MVLIPNSEAPDGLRAELYGEISEILALTERVAVPASARKKAPVTAVRGGVRKSQLSLVAGAGFEPAAFRL